VAGDRAASVAACGGRSMTRALTALAIAVVIATVVVTAIVTGYTPDSVVSAPWAYSHGGRPVLTRTWVGSFVTPADRRGALLLDLHRTTGYRGVAPVSRIHGWATFTGIARTCGVSDWPAEDIGGSANRSGSRLTIGFEGPGVAPRGWYFDVMSGSWSGDTIRAAATLEQRAGPTSTVGGPDRDTRDSTRVVLVPGSEADYAARCREISGR